MSHIYNSEFYDYIESGSQSSARVILKLLLSEISISSVLDVGCGRGAWISEWKNAGVDDIFGLDGAYVEPAELKVDKHQYQAANLAEPFDVGRKFDLVQSLEVAEHLPASASNAFIESLTRHGDIILFSAAVPGQGGENHINEQPLDFWRDIFLQYEFQAFDFVRPQICNNSDVMEWYRYNSLVYANEAGVARLPENIRQYAVAGSESIKRYGSVSWRVRTALVGLLPRTAVNVIARANARRASHGLRNGN